MPLNIDITDLKSREIIRILNMYPYGSLEIKYERVFWVSDSPEPESTRHTPGDAPSERGSPKNVGWDTRFRKMSDTLGSMMGPPAK